MTTKEICLAARDRGTRLSFREVWWHMNSLQKERMIFHIKSSRVTGGLYFFTEQGRQKIENALKIAIRPLNDKIDWNLYSFVVKSSLRKRILHELRPLPGIRRFLTASELRKRLNQNGSFPLVNVVRSLRELEKAGLVRFERLKERGIRKIYTLTDIGKEILEEILV